MRILVIVWVQLMLWIPDPLWTGLWVVAGLGLGLGLDNRQGWCLTQGLYDLAIFVMY